MSYSTRNFIQKEKKETTRYKYTRLLEEKTSSTCCPGHYCERTCGARILVGLSQRLRRLYTEGSYD